MLGRDVEVPEAVPTSPLRVIDPAALGGRDHLAVAVGHRGRHPDALRLDQGAGQRCDQTARAAPSLEGAAVGTFERQRASVRGDDRAVGSYRDPRDQPEGSPRSRAGTGSGSERARARLTHRVAPLRIAQELDHAGRALADAVHQEAGLPVLDLQADASHVAARRRASASTSPRRRPDRTPRASDFWTITSDARWNAFTALSPTPLRLVSRWMSGSPAACSVVRSRYRMPSGSSCASDPTIASWASGTSRRIRRNASMTPSGSFHGSKRETCVDEGALGVHAERRQDAAPAWTPSSARSSGSSGSIEGGMKARTRALHPGLHVLLGREDRRVVAVHDRFEELPDRPVGGGEVDVTPPDPLSLATRAAPRGPGASRPAAGRGPHVVVVVGQLARRSRASAPSRSRRISSSRCVSAPCSALCTALVTLKNRSEPSITTHVVVDRRGRSCSGTCVWSSSETPPP